jgi:hypothetical protein
VVANVHGSVVEAAMGDEGDRETRELREDAKNLLVGGATLGTFSLVTTLLVGSTCPMCIVVAPVMLGAGAYKRWKLSCRERELAKDREDGGAPGTT